MEILRFVVSMLGVFSAITVLSGSNAVSGQNYPNKPIRIVTNSVGGGSDIITRFIARGISGSLGQQIIVDNRNGNLPGEIVMKSSPDGYTLLAGSQGLWIGPLLQITSYDPVRDFAAITLMTTSPLVVVVTPSLAQKSIKELIALAKAKPGALNFASTSTGGGNHLAGELFKSMAGIDIVRVSYKSVGAALNGLLGGEVHLMFASAGSATPFVKSSRLKALAVTSLHSSPLFPGVPTVAEVGVPGYEATLMNGILAPAKTPAMLINRLNQEIVQFLRQAEVNERFVNLGEEAVPTSPEQFTAMIKSDTKKWGELIQKAGIRSDQ